MSWIMKQAKKFAALILSSVEPLSSLMLYFDTKFIFPLEEWIYGKFLFVSCCV